MPILHCMRKETWERIKTQKYYGEESIAEEGFIHGSSV